MYEKREEVYIYTWIKRFIQELIFFVAVHLQVDISVSDKCACEIYVSNIIQHNS